MNSIEFAKEVALAMSKIDRREIMETDSLSFVDMVDKINDYLFKMSAQYLKDNNIHVGWIEEELKIRANDKKLLENKP